MAGILGFRIAVTSAVCSDKILVGVLTKPGHSDVGLG